MAKEEKSQGEKNVLLALVRVRGNVGLHPDVKQTFKFLRLYRKNYCVLLPNSRMMFGMVQRVKDYITFGEIDEETLYKLLEKRGRLMGDLPVTDAFVMDKLKKDLKGFVSDVFSFKDELKSLPGLKLFFRLHPPSGGFERAGIKKSYAEGGALGYRSKDINKLIKRMI